MIVSFRKFPGLVILVLLFTVSCTGWNFDPEIPDIVEIPYEDVFYEDVEDDSAVDVEEEDDSAINVEEDDGSIVDEEEGSNIISAEMPPVGEWAITHHAGTSNCLGIHVPIPPSPPEVMLLWSDPSRDGVFMIEQGGNALPFYKFGPNDSFALPLEGYVRETDYKQYRGDLNMFNSGKIYYYLDYNRDGAGLIHGLILSDFPQDAECVSSRYFTAEYVGPAD
jgi:hypothetical protein